MSIVRTLIGNVKGPQGDTGATGPQGTPGVNGTDGAAATISVGTVSTTAYGNPAEVTNSGTSSAAVFDFVIPQGQPGEEVTDMSGLTLGTMTTQTAQYPTPQIGDNGAVLWGKVVKYFSDLRTLIGTKLNTANVVNNLTTTESGYALDARQGKALKDLLSPAVGQKQYTYEYTIPANSNLQITGTNFGFFTPTGYSIFGVRGFNSGNSNVLVSQVYPNNDTANCMMLRNVSSSAITATATIVVRYFKSDLGGQLPS